MKTNNNSFKETIKAYLDQRSEDDALFAETYKKENKNIDDCCSYITSQAKKQASNNCAVISAAEVFGWAVHYYDEDDIKVEKTSNTRSEVKTSAPKTDVKKEALKAKSKHKVKQDTNQLTLFGL